MGRRELSGSFMEPQRQNLSVAQKLTPVGTRFWSGCCSNRNRRHIADGQAAGVTDWSGASISVKPMSGTAALAIYWICFPGSSPNRRSPAGDG